MGKFWMLLALFIIFTGCAPVEASDSDTLRKTHADRFDDGVADRPVIGTTVYVLIDSIVFENGNLRFSAGGQSYIVPAEKIKIFPQAFPFIDDEVMPGTVKIVFREEETRLYTYPNGYDYPYLEEKILDEKILHKKCGC
ncbi:MAG: hypothetical protein A3B96_02455 [Candidatus Spechtbacteria bacterium RIFCSPHIGHO2_02_FULL_43_15b]|uniref:DUF5666 domain-containing protein n=1 Tax=Candidatus Spechtbacteria bacterium RIFCSPHIGHO2_01_FULL_43_30 TaxID=1802158 RepID=A0A1G2H6J8_9BACT|nr:MAG: hypothetical protein A2827_02610 [Candidatus Spechtbacteria bacterium RIFCSPHIGHO2_01_FULL_43_30]OGZ60162.1 MAG: hypothetical protein A3B96_02455 [Candidatus Spechtbacteria bacterium RIFCSPHIGHO2_02_FULL_43_15b]